MGYTPVPSGRIHHRANHTRHTTRTEDYGQCHWYGACMDITQSIHLGIAIGRRGYDHRTASHHPTRFVLQALCFKDRRYAQNKSQKAKMDVLEEGSKLSLKNRFYKIKKTFV